MHKDIIAELAKREADPDYVRAPAQLFSRQLLICFTSFTSAKINKHILNR